MAFQAFETADVVRLEVERDPTGAELLNLVANPDGAGGENYAAPHRRTGGWGWLTPVSGTTMGAGIVSSTPWLRFTLGTPGLEPWVQTEKALITPAAAAYVTATYQQSNTYGMYTCGQLVFYNAAGAVISEGQRGPSTASGVVGSAPITAVPAGAVYVSLRIWVGLGAEQAAPPNGSLVQFTAVRMIATAAQPSLSNVTRTNLCANPGAEVNVTGWTASNGAVARSTNLPRHGAGRFGVTKTATTATLENSRAATAGLTYTVSAWVVQGTSGGTGRMFIRWKNASNVAIGATVFGADVTLTADLKRATLTAAAPAGTVTMEYGVQYNGGTTTGNVFADSFLVEQAATVSSYIEGSVTHPTAAFPATPSVYWQDLTAKLTGELKTVRKAGDVGTLSAYVGDATLDPAKGSTLLRPGRQVRLMALASGLWVSMFRGRLRPVRTEYELDESTARTRIAINAVDAWAVLSGKKIKGGVGLIKDLPVKLEGLGVPWWVSTALDQQAFGVADDYTRDGTVLDNVLIARDLVNGYAWVNAYGTLNVWARDHWDTFDPYATAVLTDTVYNGDLSASYDQTDLINSVTVTVLDGTTSTDFGPYEDAAAIQRCGDVYPATFTVAPADPGTFDPAAYAAAVLASNSTPGVVIESLTVPMHTQARVNAWAATDLEQRATVTNTELAYAGNNRVLSVSHVIDPGSNVLEAKWLMALTFHRTDRAPIPTKGA